MRGQCAKVSDGSQSCNGDFRKMEMPGTRNICQRNLQIVNRASSREAVWTATDTTTEVGVPRPSGAHTSPLCTLWVLDMELHGLMFVLLGFGMTWSNPFLFLYSFFLECGCLPYAILSWEHVNCFLNCTEAQLRVCLESQRAFWT